MRVVIGELYQALCQKGEVIYNTFKYWVRKENSKYTKASCKNSFNLLATPRLSLALAIICFAIFHKLCDKLSATRVMNKICKWANHYAETL